MQTDRRKEKKKEEIKQGLTLFQQLIKSFTSFFLVYNVLLINHMNSKCSLNTLNVNYLTRF